MGVLRTPLSNKIEKYILESFLSSEISKKDFEVIEEIEYTFK